MRAALTVLLLLSLVLSGCASKGGGGDDDDGDGTDVASSTGTATGSGGGGQAGTSSASSTSTKSPASNRAPTGTLTASATSGAAPLQVNFTLAGHDADGNALTWTLTYGDGSADATGNVLPSTLAHNFTVVGNYTVNLTVSDGKLTGSASVSIAALAGAAGAVPPPVTFTGTATGLCGDPGFILTLTEGDCFPNEPYRHPFTVPASVHKVVAKLTWSFDAPAATDLDLDIEDAAGKAVGTGGGCANVSPVPNPDVPELGPFFGCTAGNEEEVVVDPVSLASEASWTGVVIPYQAYDLDYTLVITYS